MRLKITTTLLILVFLTACNPKEFWNDLKHLQFRKPYELKYQENGYENISINNTNQTMNNTTNKTTEPTPKLVYNKPYPNIFIANINSILIMENNQTYILDVPKENLKIITYLERFSVKESEFIFSSINKEEHNGGIPNVVTKSPPKIIYDNGINDEFRERYVYLLDKYNSYWNRTSAIYALVLDDFNYNNFEFFVPYSRGLSLKKEENSIVTLYNKKFLYMSDCYGGCEDKIPPIKTTFLILANGGVCPTNSFDFILGTGTEYVIGDKICEDLIEDLNYMGIKYISLAEKGTMQIILMGDKYEILYE